MLEQNFKSAISYEFSKLYGHENYLNYENFDYENEKNIRDIFFTIGSVHNARVFDTCFDIKHHQKLKTALFFCQILKYFMLYGVVLLFKV